MYSISANGELTALIETPYQLEAELQDVIASHPALLAGEQMDAGAPRRFALVTAEAGIAISESSGSFFSLDLLFVDQDAVPTLVEVKRSSDTRLRREVVGQLLEYAANACAFWSSTSIRAAYEKTAASRQLDPAANLETALGLENGEYERYWQALQSNLSQQRLRLVVVADKVPLETLRILEYLNRQMAATEVYAVAVTQHTSETIRTLSPRVLNPSLRETERKAVSSRGPRWTRERFYEALASSQPEGATRVMRAIDDWAVSTGQVEVSFGAGAVEGSIIIEFHSAPGDPYRSGRDVVFLTLWTYGTIEIDFQYLASFGAFKDRAAREELLRTLNEIGCEIAKEKVDKRPNISWTVLDENDRLERFLAIQKWVVQVAAGTLSAP